MEWCLVKHRDKFTFTFYLSLNKRFIEHFFICKVVCLEGCLHGRGQGRWWIMPSAILETAPAMKVYLPGLFSRVGEYVVQKREILPSQLTDTAKKILEL
jgi:hypothetical protein